MFIFLEIRRKRLQYIKERK